MEEFKGMLYSMERRKHVGLATKKGLRDMVAVGVLLRDCRGVIVRKSREDATSLNLKC